MLCNRDVPILISILILVLVVILVVILVYWQKAYDWYIGIIIGTDISVDIGNNC